MSDMENPYASPRAESVPENQLMEKAALTDTMLGYLREASPWMRFIGIVGFVGCGFMAIFGIAAIAGMGALVSMAESIPELGAFGNIFTTAFSVSMGFNFLIVAVLLFFPALFTWNFGAKLKSWFQGGKEQELELALKNNKSLWKFYGVLTIINLSFIPILIVIGIIAAVASVLI